MLDPETYIEPYRHDVIDKLVEELGVCTGVYFFYNICDYEYDDMYKLIVRELTYTLMKTFFLTKSIAFSDHVN